MNQREAANVLRSYGAVIVDADAPAVDWVVVGADESPLAEADLLGPVILNAAATGSLEIVPETELWQRLGLLDVEQAVHRYHTPAMLAHLLGVSVRVIRRWHRRGLITPVQTLHKLPYFDFQEVATARRLAQWVVSGASPEAIERPERMQTTVPNCPRCEIAMCCIQKHPRPSWKEVFKRGIYADAAIYSPMNHSRYKGLLAFPYQPDG